MTLVFLTGTLRELPHITSSFLSGKGGSGQKFENDGDKFFMLTEGRRGIRFLKMITGTISWRIAEGEKNFSC